MAARITVNGVGLLADPAGGLYWPDEKLLEFIQGQKDVQACADGLGQLALDMGSRDNVSCVVIEAVEG